MLTGLLLALAPILLLGLADVDFGSLLPVYPSDALPVLEGALPNEKTALLAWAAEHKK